MRLLLYNLSTYQDKPLLSAIISCYIIMCCCLLASFLLVGSVIVKDLSVDVLVEDCHHRHVHVHKQLPWYLAYMVQLERFLMT